MNERRTSFYGDVLIIILVCVIIFFAYMLMHPDPFLQIEEIYNKYGVTENSLIPLNNIEYATSLKAVNNEYAEMIADYIYLDIEKTKLQQNINQYILQSCIPNDLYRKFETYISNKNLLLRKFKDTESEKNNKLYWYKYVEELEKNNVDAVYESIKELPKC